MVNYDTVLIRYGELSTKGHNRRDFIKRLESNLKYALRDFEGLQYRRTYDRIYIQLKGGEDTEKMRRIISGVFGISSFSFTEKIESSLEAIEARCLEIAKENASTKHSFKMITKRHDKNFPLNSDAINRAVASVILEQTDMQVDVHHPDLSIRVEVREDATYLTSEKIPGAGGYPTGINGKVLLLLSGGIDSPVAAYELMKRGLTVEAIHFASPPYTSDHALSKVLTLASKMSVYEGHMKVHVINLTKNQMSINRYVGDSYSITILRRMMFRIAEETAQKNGCLALATGESVGQVASQTLESMAVINDVVHLPVLRPLVCMDKVEIIDLARRLGTYETSIEPYEDCCTIFKPQNPVTRPLLRKCEAFETKWDWRSELDQCLEQDDIRIVKPAAEEEFL